MNRIVSLILIAAIFICGVQMTAFASDGDFVRVYVNGEMLSAYGKLINGNSVIPMRAFLEKIGFEVVWDGATRTVTATTDGTVMQTAADTNKLIVNGKSIDMPCNTTIIDGTTYVPVRAIGENAGFKVGWLNATKSAILTNGNDKYNYYEDTPSLLPEFGSAVGGASFDSISEDNINGNVCYYYTYKGYAEDKAFEYGDILCSQFGYEYESMQLGDNYSKLYTYTIGDVQTVIAVGKTDDVPYVYIYPDINENYVEEQNSSNITADGSDDGQTNEHATGAQYYEGTLVPTFEYICGGRPLGSEQLESGTMYVYDGTTFEMMDYLSGLMRFGFVQYDMQMGDMFEVTYTFVKGDDYVVVSSSMFFHQIYILPIDGITEE